MSARNAGPISHAVAWMPATTTTVAAAPMRITKARGRAAWRSPTPFASGAGTAPTTPGPGTGVVMGAKLGRATTGDTTRGGRTDGDWCRARDDRSRGGDTARSGNLARRG